MKRFLFAIIFILSFLLTSASPARAYVLGRPEPGEGSCDIKCSSLSVSLCTDVANRSFQCSSCFFCDPILNKSGLENFQKILKENDNNTTTSMESYYAGTEVVSKNPNGGTGGAVGSLAGSLATIVFGCIGSDCPENPAAAGLLQNSSKMISFLYENPPASTGEYFADIGKNFGFTKTAYAQGFGFNQLSNILPLWKAMRNVSYIFFVVAFLYVGIAIMFRIKIDPKTVVSIQNAIPKMVIALILITFSYAIVGLMVDFMYLIIYLAIAAFNGVPGVNLAHDQEFYSTVSFFDAVGLFFKAGFDAPIKLFSGSLHGNVASSLSAVGWVKLIVGSAVGGVVGVVVSLIFGIIGFFLILKLFFSLLQNYIMIILSLIFAPIKIMLGVFPGGQGGFGPWFMDIVSNLLVFPAVAIALFIGQLLIGQQGTQWTPPVLSVSGGSLTAFLGLGMLLFVTKIPEMVRAAFKFKPSGYGSAIGESLGPLRMAGRIGGGPIAEKALPTRALTPQWYWKVYDFGKGQKWWS